MSLGGVSSLWRVAGVPEEPGNGADGRSQARRQDWGGRGEERCSDQRGNGRGAEDGFEVMQISLISSSCRCQIKETMAEEQMMALMWCLENSYFFFTQMLDQRGNGRQAQFTHQAHRVQQILKS